MTQNISQIPNEDELLDYPAAFGLWDNPFNPQQFDGVSGAALDSLFEIPLAIDEDPRLEPLFVEGAGPFRKHMDAFKGAMKIAGYQSGENPKSPRKSFAFRVFGPQGSGKSTLTNRMVAWLKDCFTREQLVDGQLSVVKRSVRRGQLEPVLENIRVAADGQDGRWCCLVLDDVLLEDEEQLHNLYEELRYREIAVVMFEILNYAHIRRPLPFERVGLRSFRTTGLSHDQAAAFVTERVSRFRDASFTANGGAGLESYPFDSDAVGAMVGSDAALTLRTLNRVLHEALIQELQRRTTNDAVDGLTEAELRDRLIDVVAAYNELNSFEEEAA